MPRSGTSYKPGESGNPEGLPGRPAGVKEKNPRRAKGKALRLLDDMRHVYDKPRDMDVTAGQRMCRDLLECDPKAFMAQLTRLEQIHAPGKAGGWNRGGGAKAAVEVAEPVDDGEGRALEQVERLMEEWGDEKP